MTIRISQINTCSFCVDLNTATLQNRGVSLAKIEALSNWEASDLFSAEEHVALEYAEAATRTDGAISDSLMDRLRGILDDDAIVELTGLISFQNLSSKINSAPDVPAQGFCSLPQVKRSASVRVDPDTNR